MRYFQSNCNHKEFELIYNQLNLSKEVFQRDLPVDIKKINLILIITDVLINQIKNFEERCNLSYIKTNPQELFENTYFLMSNNLFTLIENINQVYEENKHKLDNINIDFSINLSNLINYSIPLLSKVEVNYLEFISIINSMQNISTLDLKPNYKTRSYLNDNTFFIITHQGFLVKIPIPELILHHFRNKILSTYICENKCIKVHSYHLEKLEITHTYERFRGVGKDSAIETRIYHLDPFNLTLNLEKKDTHI